MKPDRINELFANQEQLLPHRAYLEALVKPSVDIHITTETPETHQSRLGGHPLVEKGFVWPKYQIGEYKFLGQINFSEIKDRPTLLPETGILSLFYAFDEEGEIFLGDDGYVLGYFWRSSSDLEIQESQKPTPESKKIVLTGGVDMPRHRDLRNDWPFDATLLEDELSGDDSSENYMLGYPSFYSLAYDPTPSLDWVSLLTLESRDEFDWCWHDGDKLMVFIEKEALKHGNFSALKADAG